ncbi:MAG TPA: hypothetical protein VF401_02445 [Candidatus Saccharimonadales bacterium]
MSEIHGDFEWKSLRNGVICMVPVLGYAAVSFARMPVLSAQSVAAEHVQAAEPCSEYKDGIFGTAFVAENGALSVRCLLPQDQSANLPK